jgi:hypothetical protein
MARQREARQVLVLAGKTDALGEADVVGKADAAGKAEQDQSVKEEALGIWEM